MICLKALIADNRGRITLGSKILDQHGREFAVVSMPREIVLVPIAKDPLAELQRLGKEAGIDKYTIKELRKMAYEEAEKEALKNVRL